MSTDNGATDLKSQDDPQLGILIRLFDRLFSDTYHTRLVRGEEEPVYLPAKDGFGHHRIVFAHGYFASALHEIAHWCIAGEARRQLEDYGYWYCPDGRDACQQAEFEKVEVKPQAIEWAFTLAAGRSFRVSTDNLNGAEPDRDAFTNAVQQQLLSYLENGFPSRAAQFIQALHQQFNTPPLCPISLQGQAA
ncbi:elongation factor P hydroxylase [Alteromonas aestuariivivens]|uniref:elongation factor P hydroxylase n=1 Tax=Alteromonas aestuariivivens TaxID=1938339 RepID=UPI00248278B1|nr:elongation factor P hydroxylase [Alteromonas aestuariivivens]